MKQAHTILFVLMALSIIPQSAFAEATIVGAPVFDAERGTWRHTITSPYTGDETLLEVLLPEDYTEEKAYRVLYLLPVEAGKNTRFGDSMAVAARMKLADSYEVIVVAPTFDTVSWFGNHATDATIRHEDHMNKAVVPYIDATYATVEDARGRFLLGYSKSGWGALSLILRNPSVYGYAASWDAPLLLDSGYIGLWQTGDHYGTPENMDAYLPVNLIKERAGPFRQVSRLVISGEKLFGTFIDRRHTYEGPSHTEGIHALLEEAGIKHTYAPNINAPHTWNARWMKPVTALLFDLPKME